MRIPREDLRFLLDGEDGFERHRESLEEYTDRLPCTDDALDAFDAPRGPAG